SASASLSAGLYVISLIVSSLHCQSFRLQTHRTPQSLFLQRYARHHNLHSFPTRRSSDLITLKQMLRDFIGIRVNRAKKSGMVNITSSVNSRERSGINTILHELNPLFTINVTMRDIKSKNVYSRVNSKAT